jgi:aspartate aminotransferase-like enzyme
MLCVGPYVFKRAETSQEFEQIHCLNYRVFVSEIPQHEDPGTGRLIDKFHEKNAYFIVLRDGRLIAMVSAHDRPPFSIASRLSDPSILEQPGTRPLEVRLLAIEPAERNNTIFVGLLWLLYEYVRCNRYTHWYISGLQDRLPLYRRLGFEPIGPAAVSGGAAFVPMVGVLDQMAVKLEKIHRQWRRHLERMAEWAQEPVCLLPGPVAVAAVVQEAFRQPALYHRGPEFIALFEKVRRTLGALVGGRDVALLNGSGTLANEAVAATLAVENSAECQVLSAESKAENPPSHPPLTTHHSPLTTHHSPLTRGVLLVNGEFGERLARQASRFGLRPRVLSWPWGKPWDLDELDTALAAEPPGSWVWGVHQESSTGVLNDLPGLVRLARARGQRVCADCISSLGAVPLDLSGVYLATGASGKSLGAYAGVAIIFADAAALASLDRSHVPSYLDVAAALANQGPCYTFPSQQLRALDAALADYATPALATRRYAQYAALGAYVRRRLRELGLEPLADERWASPVVTTFAPPGEQTLDGFVAMCRSWGFAIGGQSGYLVKRRLVQIATMGEVTRAACKPLFEHLDHWLGRRLPVETREGAVN